MTLGEARDDFERTYIARTLEQERSVVAAAAQLGVNRTYLYKRMSKFDIKPPKRKPGTGGNAAWRELSDEC